MRQTYRVHVHRLDEFHILDVLFLRQRTSCLWTERMTVGTFHDHFLTIDKQTVVLSTLYMRVFQVFTRKGMTVFDGTEAEFLTLYM